MADKNFEIEIKATDNASATIAKPEQSLDSLGAAAGEAQVKLDEQATAAIDAQQALTDMEEAVADASKALKQMEQDASAASDGIEELGNDAQTSTNKLSNAAGANAAAGAKLRKTGQDAQNAAQGAGAGIDGMAARVKAGTASIELFQSALGRVTAGIAIFKLAFDVTTWLTRFITGIEDAEAKLAEMDRKWEESSRKRKEQQAENARILADAAKAQVDALTQQLSAAMSGEGWADQITSVRNNIYDAMDTLSRRSGMMDADTVSGIMQELRDLKEMAEGSASDPTRARDAAEATRWRGGTVGAEAIDEQLRQQAAGGAVPQDVPQYGTRGGDVELRNRQRAMEEALQEPTAALKQSASDSAEAQQRMAETLTDTAAIMTSNTAALLSAVVALGQSQAQLRDDIRNVANQVAAVSARSTRVANKT